RRMPAGQGAGSIDDNEPATVRAAVEPTRADGFSSRRTPDASDARPAPIVAGAVSAQKPEAARNSNVLFTRQSPVLSVETTGPRSITIGKGATYVVTLNNSGDAAAQDVKVTVRIPAWTEVMGATATNGSAQPGGDDATQPLTWQVPRLEAKGKE